MNRQPRNERGALVSYSSIKVSISAPRERMNNQHKKIKSEPAGAGGIRREKRRE